MTPGTEVQTVGDEWGEPDPGYGEYDPDSRVAWKAARDEARAAGGDLAELTDMHPADRASRITDLARSDIPDGRARAIAEVNVLLGAEAAAMFDFDKGFQNDLWDALAAAPWSTPGAATVPALLPLPDNDWVARREVRGCLVLQRRMSGRALTVRESGTTPGRYYAAVDGQHLSARAGPQTYSTALDAMTAAMSAAIEASNHNPPGATP